MRYWMFSGLGKTTKLTVLDDVCSTDRDVGNFWKVVLA